MKRRRTTNLIFDRYQGTWPFPRWSVRHDDLIDGKVFYTFWTKLGCRLYARRLHRIPIWFR